MVIVRPPLNFGVIKQQTPSYRVTATGPVPPALRRRLSIGLAAGVLSLASTTIQGLYRADFDPWHQAISALSLGPGGWLQMLNLIAFGAAVLTTVGPWHRILAGATGSTAYPVLTALVGVSFIGVGLIPQDPAPGYDPQGLGLETPTPHGLVHLAFAAIAAASSVAGLFVMAARFARNPAWHRWPLYSFLTGLVVILCVVVYGVWSVQSTGFAGTFERTAMIAPMFWMFAFLRRLRAGTPLMVTRNALPQALTAQRRPVHLLHDDR